MVPVGNYQIIDLDLVKQKQDFREKKKYGSRRNNRRII